MNYRQYFEQHPEESTCFCECYADKTEQYFLVMYDGEPSLIKWPGGTADVTPRHCDENEDLKAFSLAVNNGYYLYHGWTDEHIALDVMHHIGCASCPFRDSCSVMDEEMEDE